MRIIERVRAKAGGYWWKRCTCGRTFGGHERGWSWEKKLGYTDFWCPTCTAERKSPDMPPTIAPGSMASDDRGDDGDFDDRG